MKHEILASLAVLLGVGCTAPAEEPAAASAASELTATKHLLPKQVVCDGQITRVPLKHFEVTDAELADPSKLLTKIERTDDEPPWRVGLTKESLELADESFLCDGYASITFALADAVAPVGTKSKQATGDSYYEMRGDETNTKVVCTFVY